MHPYLKRWPLLRVEVAEQSMLPGLHPGDWLVAWRTRRIRPGHVVLAWHPARADFMLVKRAVRRVEGGWWLASDNPRAGAVDSSRFGPVPPELIVGRVLARYWPFPPHPIPPLIIRNERRLLPRVPLSGRPVDVAGPRSPGGSEARH